MGPAFWLWPFSALHRSGDGVWSIEQQWSMRRCKGTENVPETVDLGQGSGVNYREAYPPLIFPRPRACTGRATRYRKNPHG